MEIEDLMEKFPKNQLFINFVIKMIQFLLSQVLDKPFCQTEIHLGCPCSRCSSTPMKMCRWKFKRAPCYATIEGQSSI